MSRQLTPFLLFTYQSETESIFAETFSRRLTPFSVFAYQSATDSVSAHSSSVTSADGLLGMNGSFAPKVATPASSIFGRFETCRPAGTMSVPGEDRKSPYH